MDTSTCAWSPIPSRWIPATAHAPVDVTNRGDRCTDGNVDVTGNSRFSQAGSYGSSFGSSRAVYSHRRRRPDSGGPSEPVRGRRLHLRPGAALGKRFDRTTIVDLTWQDRRNPAEIRHIAVRGNTVTHEPVTRRHLFVEPGERFRRTDVRNIGLLSLEGPWVLRRGSSRRRGVADELSGDMVRPDLRGRGAAHPALDPGGWDRRRHGPFRCSWDTNSQP